MEKSRGGARPSLAAVFDARLPLPRSDELIICTSCSSCPRTRPLLPTSAFDQMKDEESASTLCNAVVSFAQEEMPLVAGAEGKGLPLVELLLSLTACDLPRIPILTLDFWLELQVGEAGGRGGVGWIGLNISWMWLGLVRAASSLTHAPHYLFPTNARV